MPTESPRSLADQFRTWSDERLGTLLAARPDLASPPPADSGQLASRAAVRLSVQRALDHLDRLHREVLLAVVQLGPTDASAVRSAVHAEPDRVDAALERLGDLALVWGGSELRAITPAADLLAVPAGPDPARVAAAVEDLEPAARAMLEHLFAGDRTGSLIRPVAEPVRGAATGSAAQLLAAGLLVEVPGSTPDRIVAAVPWTVRRHLGGGRSTAVPLDRPPDFAATERIPDRADRLAAGAAFEFVHRVEVVLEHFATRPTAALRGGGLGVRDLRAIATSVHTDTPGAALLLETAAASGLLGLGATDDLDSAWLPTEAYDHWRESPLADRWHRLAAGWLANPRLVSLIGGRDADRPINALAPGLERSWLPEHRAAVLSELAGLDPRQRLAEGTGRAGLQARLHWRRPTSPAERDRLIADHLAEAGQLGILAQEALSVFGRALIEDRDPAGVLAPLLPEPVDHVLLQADLTATAPGPLRADISRRLALLAEVESRGSATVFRFDAGSLRRALEHGWSATEVADFLAEVSRTPVPQALSYLVEDVARSFGRLRLGPAASYLRSDDETALTELLHRPGVEALRLRRIAPTVAISPVDLAVLLPRLREIGAAGVLEAEDGTLHLSGPERYRASGPHRSEVALTARAAARRGAQLTATVAAIRAGDRAAEHRPRTRSATRPADLIALFREAADRGELVWIGFADGHGRAQEAVVHPVEVSGGQLLAETEEGPQAFPIHRITGASISGSPPAAASTRDHPDPRNRSTP